MLSKTKLENILYNNPDFYYENPAPTPTKSGAYTIYTVTSSKKWKIKLKFHYYCWMTAGGGFMVAVNGTNWEYATVNLWDTDIDWTSENEYEPGVINVKVYALSTSSNGKNLKITWLYISSLPADKTESYNVAIYPNNIVEIWALWVGVIYWNLNWKFLWGIIRDKTTTATTGSIAPGNFVGYLEVNYNGSIVKIPYYL